MGELGRLHQRAILDAHPVVGFIALLEAAQNGHGVLHAGLLHQHGLEPARQGGILLDVLAVFVQRGGPHAAQFAAGQGGLDHVGGIHRAFRRAGAHQRVELVDEQDDLALAPDDFLQERLETVLEFAAVFRPRQHRAQVQRNHPLVFESFRHVARHDAARQPFGNGGFAHAGLADQDGIVLGAARQHLHHAADLGIAPDHGIQLALAGLLRQVAPVLLEGFVFVFGRLVRHPAVAAHTLERLQDGINGDAQMGSGLRRLAVFAAEGRQKQVLGADIFVLHLGRQLGGGLHRGLQVAGEAAVQTLALHLGPGAQHPVQHLAIEVGLDPDLLQNGRNHAPLLPDQRQHQVKRVHLAMAIGLGQLLGLPDGFLGFRCQFVDVHEVQASFPSA